MNSSISFPSFYIYEPSQFSVLSSHFLSLKLKIQTEILLEFDNLRFPFLFYFHLLSHSNLNKKIIAVYHWGWRITFHFLAWLVTNNISNCTKKKLALLCFSNFQFAYQTPNAEIRRVPPGSHRMFLNSSKYFANSNRQSINPRKWHNFLRRQPKYISRKTEPKYINEKNMKREIEYWKCNWKWGFRNTFLSTCAVKILHRRRYRKWPGVEDGEEV